MVISPALSFPLYSPHFRGSFWSYSTYHDGYAAAARYCVAGIKVVAVWWSWSLYGEDWRLEVRVTGPSTALEGRFRFCGVFFSHVDYMICFTYSLGCLVCDSGDYLLSFIMIQGQAKSMYNHWRLFWKTQRGLGLLGKQLPRFPELQGAPLLCIHCGHGSGLLQ